MLAKVLVSANVVTSTDDFPTLSWSLILFLFSMSKIEKSIWVPNNIFSGRRFPSYALSVKTLLLYSLHDEMNLLNTNGKMLFLYFISVFV
jgi:hypothetical protein